jgi:hypothetical protein
VVRQPKDERLSEAALIAATGISQRNLIRWRQQGLIPTIEPRRGRGRGRGTTPLEYPLIAVATIRRHEELRMQFKRVGDRRWYLWIEGYPVRAASHFADTLASINAFRSEIKTLGEVETVISKVGWKPTNMPRGDPLRVIFRDLSDTDLAALTTMVVCMLLGIRLPLFDEPNPHPFRVFKSAFGLPKDWQMPPGMFDAFPYLHEQIRNALSKATPDELEGARIACRVLSRLLDDPEKSRRGAIVISGAALPWRPIKLASLMWPSPLVRAATVGLVILGIRAFTAAFGETASVAFASVARTTEILFSALGPIDPLGNRPFGYAPADPDNRGHKV